MGSRGALVLLSAIAVLALVQLSEAQFGGDVGTNPFLFPGNGVNPIGRPPRPPPRPSSTTTRRPPSDGGSGCNCPTTPEYNPVCGTDGVSYGNPQKLNCAKNCGRNVSILHYGNCTPPDPNAPTSSTTPSSTTPRRRG